MKPILRLSLSIVNVILAIAGGFLSAVGGIIQFNTEMIDGYLAPLVQLIPSGSGFGGDVWTLFNHTSIGLLAVGITISLLGIYGCLTSLCLSKGLLVMHMIVMTVLAVINGTAIAILLTTDMRVELTSTLRLNMVQKYRGESAMDTYSAAWNYAFVQFSCCGAESYSSDFQAAILWNKSTTATSGNESATVPSTCCTLTHPAEFPNYGTPLFDNCTSTPTQQNSNVKQNCADEMYAYLHYYDVFMSACIGGVICVQVVCLLLDVAAARYLKGRRRKIIPDEDDDTTPL